MQWNRDELFKLNGRYTDSFYCINSNLEVLNKNQNELLNSSYSQATS